MVANARRKASSAPTLVLTYNVDGSPVALLRDLYQGLTTGTTDCHLCDLTFGRLLKDRSWRQFVESLPLEVDFQLRSSFVRRHPTWDGHRFPAGFVQRGHGVPELVIDAAALNDVADLEELRRLIGDTVESMVAEMATGMGT